MALAAADDKPFADADRRVVNDMADGDLPSVALRADGTMTRTGDAGAALTAIARSAVELLGGAGR